MKHCQECNLDFPDSFRFCGSCGGALRDSLRCPGCGELVESKWTFCTNCGRELSLQSTNDQASLPATPKRSDILDAPMSSLSPPDSSPSQTMTMPSGQRSEKVPPQEWYAAPELFAEADETTVTSIRRQEMVPKSTVAVPGAIIHPQSGNGKTPPTLTMLAAYGETETASPEWQRRYGLLVRLLLLILIGLLGAGGWYWWWTHGASVAQSPLQADSSTAPAAADSSSAASSASSATTRAARMTTSATAEDEWKRLREKRIGAKPSENSEIIAALEAAEKKYPTDYRFPYERATLSIKGITSHHQAFSALALAADKAIDNGKAQEMLDSLMADKDADFYKLSRGHHEWQTLEEALRDKDKAPLKPLRH